MAGEVRVLRAIGSADTTAQVNQANAVRAQASSPPAQDLVGLAGFIVDQWILMRRHRDNTASGWAHRLLRAMRAFNGIYEPEIIEQIKRFGGSQVYARIIAMKSRGTTSLLRDVYLGPERPWSLDPSPDPPIPPEIIQSIHTLIEQEVMGAVQGHLQGMHMQQAHQAGVAAMQQQPQADPSQPNVTPAQPPPAPPPPPPLPDANAVRDRYNELEEAARQAAKRNAAKKAKVAEDKIQELLSLGGFYSAFAEFLVDLPLFPYAVLKGPTVQIKTVVEWQSPPPPSLNPNPGTPGLGSNNPGFTGPPSQPTPTPSQNPTPRVTNKPVLCWERVSPFDIYWTPGVSKIEDANIIERQRLTRKELNDCLDLPGYDQQAVRAVLNDYGRGGLVDNWDQTDAERAILESRENPRFNQSGLIACLSFQGYVQGRMLIDQGMDENVIPDPDRDYFIQAWMIGRYVIKVQLSPSPRKRHQYYVTSFEKVPGTVVGNGLPDILDDITTVANATLRALVNNLSISSGPQVTVNSDRLADGEDGSELYPWKRWFVKSDPFGNNAQPAISFFQPQSNAQELMQVYSAFSNLADEMSAIPKSTMGQSGPGATGRTASGMALLMSNAAKILQTVAANIDRDVIEGMLENLLDMIMLTDTSGLLDGQEKVRVLGVNVAIAKEAKLQQKLTFLQLTANPIDMQITGLKGRAVVLKGVADNLDIPGADIVPTQEELEDRDKANQAVQMAQAQAGQANAVHQQAAGGPQTAARQAQGQQAPKPTQGGPRMNSMAPVASGPPAGTQSNVQGAGGGGGATPGVG